MAPFRPISFNAYAGASEARDARAASSFFFLRVNRYDCYYRGGATDAATATSDLFDSESGAAGDVLSFFRTSSC